MLTDHPPLSTRSPGRWHFLLFALAWTIFAVYGSLVPLAYRDVSMAEAVARFRDAPGISFGIGARADLATNVLLFIPLTFAWMGVLTADRGPIARAVAGLILIPGASALAFAIEFAQIWFTGRTTSLNDIFGESVGGLIGVMAWLIAGPRLVAWLRRYAGEPTPRSTLRWVIEAYLLGFVMFSVIPLDLTMSLTELYHKYQRGQVILVPFAYSYREPMRIAYQFFADIVTFVPVGAWVAISSPRVLRLLASPLRRAVIGGAVFAGAVELAQLLVLSRYTDTTDIVLGAIGAGLGAWLVDAWTDPAAAGPRRMSAARAETRVGVNDAGAGDPYGRVVAGRRARRSLAGAFAVIGAYTIFLVVGFWYPFEWTEDRRLLRERYESFFDVPLLALYKGSSFNALRQVLIRFLLFAGLGALIGRAVWLPASPVWRMVLAVAGLAYGAALALGIEMAQIMMPSKVADLTEVVVCWVGLGVGLLVMRRIVRRP